jgi:hypothetical protein
MKLLFLIFVTGVFLLGCSRRIASPDAIDNLMVEVAHEEVPSYLYQSIKLPATATPEQLVSALSKGGDMYWTGMKITSFKIVNVRAAQSGPDAWEHYTAVLLDTNVGQKILLLRPEPDGSGWYHKLYDAKYKAT